MFWSRSIAHTDWVQYFIIKQELNTCYLYPSQDIIRHDQTTPNSASFFSGGTTLWIIKNSTIRQF